MAEAKMKKEKAQKKHCVIKTKTTTENCSKYLKVKDIMLFLKKLIRLLLCSNDVQKKT